MESVLSPKELARAIGVSESSLKRWADEGRIRASRTAGGHRRIRLSDAVRFIREAHVPVVRPELLGLADVEAAPTVDAADDPGEALFAVLQRGDAARARGLITSAYLDGQSLATILDGPVRHALARLGELWQHSNDGIFTEHRAVDICVQALAELRSVMPQPEPDAPAAIGAAPGDDPYMIPTLMAAMVVAEAGYAAVNLGPDTPLDVLGEAADRCGAALVWLSATAPIERRTLGRGLGVLARRLAGRNAWLVVGGQRTDPDLVAGHANVQHVASMSELAAFARGLRSGRSAPAGGARHTPVG